MDNAERRILALLALLAFAGCGHSDEARAAADVATYCSAVCVMELRCGLPASDAGRCQRECPQIVAAVSTLPGKDYGACTRHCLERGCNGVLRCIADECA